MLKAVNVSNTSQNVPAAHISTSTSHYTPESAVSIHNDGTSIELTFNSIS